MTKSERGPQKPVPRKSVSRKSVPHKSGREPPDPDADVHLHWHHTTVHGRNAEYGEGGAAGPLLVFLHGWALGQHVYKRALKRLVAQGLHVLAPAMPGFGGTPGLPRKEFNLAGYAAWVSGFLEALEVNEPVTLVGHSFGGGVAIQTAHDFPDQISQLVVVNSIGGTAWRSEGGVLRTLAERPLWDWGLHMRADIAPVRQLRRVLPVIVEDAVPNLFRNPAAIWRVAQLARTTNLTDELEELRRRGLPVTVLWGERDTVIPALARDSMVEVLGHPKTVAVEGGHTWLLSDPESFGEVMTTIVGLNVADEDGKSEAS